MISLVGTLMVSSEMLLSEPERVLNACMYTTGCALVPGRLVPAALVASTCTDQSKGVWPCMQSMYIAHTYVHVHIKTNVYAGKSYKSKKQNVLG